ncbi:MAG: V-type ATP synthase subunit I [Oscillospiraceae bacterium]|nr:V-type ATP synthase subunit I [Oscillospiraceae bacterium]
MAIACMKRFHCIGLENDRETILYNLQRLGCVQIDSQSGRLADQTWAEQAVRADTGLAEVKSRANLLQSAIDTLVKYAGAKGPGLMAMFTPRPSFELRDLSDPVKNKDMLSKAMEIQTCAKEIGILATEHTRLENRRDHLMPWEKLDIPLETSGSGFLNVEFGKCPSSVDAAELAERCQNETLCHVAVINSDADQHYLCVMYHPSEGREVARLLKHFGFSREQFKDVYGLASVNIAQIKAGLKENELKQKEYQAKISQFAELRMELLQTLDAINVEVQRQEAAQRLLSTGSAFCLEGWVPENKTSAVQALVEKLGCAYEFRSHEPEEEDDVPILLRNSRLIEPFNMVTNLYALPKYGNIDPNPLFAPFYAIFFGMMFADIAYGLILVALGLVVTKKAKPKGGMGYAFRLMQICGVTTVMFGFIYGGLFGDAVNKVAETFFNRPDITLKPLWVSPDAEPMTILYFAIALGVLQVLVGIGVRGYILIRDGQPVAAALETLPRWFLFVSIGLTALTGQSNWIFSSLIIWVLTQGYAKKGIFGKFFGGMASLFDITNYLSDVLSYSRLMALGLAGGIIASVFNVLASMPGAIPIVGPILFLIIFLFGHAFNMGINIIGTFVHAARLQYVEYFAKFYESGGKPFRPLVAQTKYVDVTESEF